MKVKVFVLDGLKIHKHMIEDGIFLNMQKGPSATKLRTKALTLNRSADAER